MPFQVTTSSAIKSTLAYLTAENIFHRVFSSTFLSINVSRNDILDRMHRLLECIDNDFILTANVGLGQMIVETKRQVTCILSSTICNIQSAIRYSTINILEVLSFLFLRQTCLLPTCTITDIKCKK